MITVIERDGKSNEICEIEIEAGGKQSRKQEVGRYASSGQELQKKC